MYHNPQTDHRTKTTKGEDIQPSHSYKTPQQSSPEQNCLIMQQQNALPPGSHSTPQTYRSLACFDKTIIYLLFAMMNLIFSQASPAMIPRYEKIHHLGLMYWDMNRDADVFINEFIYFLSILTAPWQTFSRTAINLCISPIDLSQPGPRGETHSYRRGRDSEHSQDQRMFLG